MSIRITVWAAGAVIARAKEAALDGVEEWA